MILILSGEGPTDIGTRRPKETGWEFVPGPMAWIVDKLLNSPDKLDYSILEGHAKGYDWVRFLSETDLGDLRYLRPRFFPHSQNTFGNQFFRANAYQLGKHAQAIAIERNDTVIAVFFRDSDGTNSAPATLTSWKTKFASMQAGFRLSEFQSGVPMVPRPKSEAWMLCGLFKREDASRDCGGLEDEPGNDASPNSLKTQLTRHLGHEPSAEEQSELVSGGTINPELIDLSSFTAFREALHLAYANATPPLN
jgi:hypothetical protein